MRRNREPARALGRLAVGLAVALAAAGSAAAQYGAPANGEWPTYGGDLGSTKYSPLDQIDRDNFGDLEIAWRWQSADAVLSLTMPDGSEWRADSRLVFDELNRRDPERWRDGQPPTITNLKATPLMVGDRLFLNMPTSAAAAVDARTGETLWVYNPKSYEEGTTTMSARWNQRGVAYWSDGPDRTDERILFGTDEDATLAVLEARGALTHRPQLPQGLPLFKPPYPRMTAIDMNTGEHLWMRPMGDGDRIRNLPMLRHLDLPPLGGDSGRVGPVLTKTLLIYALTTGGTGDRPRLVAFDKLTGEEVASVDLPGGAIGTPMTYMSGGRQYIALTVGGGRVPELIALALPEADPDS